MFLRKMGKSLRATEGWRLIVWFLLNLKPVDCESVLRGSLCDPTCRSAMVVGIAASVFEAQVMPIVREHYYHRMLEQVILRNAFAKWVEAIELFPPALLDDIQSHWPDGLDDADPRVITTARFKAFTDVGLVEAMTRERWGASKWARG